MVLSVYKKDYQKGMHMKWYIKHGIALAVVMCSHAYALSPEGRMLLSTIAQAQNQIFNVENLFAQQLDTRRWYDASNAITAYVKKNTRDAQLLKIGQKFQDSAIAITNTLQIMWGAYFSQRRILTATQIAQAEQQLAQLTRMKNELSSVLDSGLLSNIQMQQRATVQADVAEVLENALLYAISPLERVPNNFARRVQYLQ